MKSFVFGLLLLSVSSVQAATLQCPINGSVRLTGSYQNNQDCTNYTGRLTNSGSLSNYGRITNRSQIFNHQQFTNFQNGSVENYDSFRNDGSSSRVYNHGTFYNRSGGRFESNAGGVLVNQSSGTFVNGGGRLKSIGGNLVNQGTFILSDGSVDATVINNTGSFVFNGGVLSFETFNGDLANTGGSLGGGYPFFSGRNIVGNYSQDEFSTLLIAINGTEEGSDYDTLVADGVATLDGALYLDVDYSSLSSGDSFDILKADVINGTFASINSKPLNAGLSWELSYQTDHDGAFDVVTATVVPVPAAVWLFGSGLGLLGWMRRKA